ncbi:protein of unknown function [Magnetospirillum sp. XM-1]|nr:protein of unknown function [Magnetospirillum sp. XM-1]
MGGKLAGNCRALVERLCVANQLALLDILVPYGTLSGGGAALLKMRANRTT